MPRKRQNSPEDDGEPRRKWRRVIFYSDSDESESTDSEQVIVNTVVDLEQPQNEPEEHETGVDPGGTEDPLLVSQQVPQQSETIVEEPELDAELLEALGDSGDESPEYGENIVQNLAKRWLPILRKGLPKETKDVLLKEYTLPENCKLLRAPKLNAEMAAAITDLNRARDKRIETNQNQLGLGVSAVGKGLSLLLASDDKQKKVQAIKSISDGCRILADLHYTNTQSRIKLITPTLDKAFVRSIQDLERDDTLFGSKLSQTIKASKTIEKQGLQIKRPPPVQKGASTSASQPNVTTRSRSQGNWAGPSRYQSSNRGGRGGGGQRYGYGAATRKTPASSSTSKTSATTNNNNKQRAQTR